MWGSMNTILGAPNRILEIDLSHQQYHSSQISMADRELYLGGKGLGLKLLYDRIKIGVDPLGPENMIVFSTGVLMGTGAPCSGRFEAVTKSPLTGIMTTSSCGGPFGMALKTSGWDAVIITGKAQEPTYLVISAEGVAFKSAAHLWGKDSDAAQTNLLEEGKGAVVIGPAGENAVRFANIRSGHRFLGRGGMGAVLGAKGIKGIVARGGEYKIIPVHKKQFSKTVRKLAGYINQNPITSGNFRFYGTNANVHLSNNAGILPVRNFTGGSHGEAHKISGEAMAERFDTQWDTCKPCIIKCGHKGTIGGQVRSVPEYETIGLLGANLSIFDPEVITDWNDLCGKYGMDTITLGGTLAWAMEATEKGLLESNLKFGSPEGVTDMIRDIALNRGLGKDLAMGSRWAAHKYGGEDFAMHVKGLELPAYDPRGSVGQGLSYATANRGGCHLSSYVLALESYFGLADPKAQRWKHYMVKFYEDVYAALNSMDICQFTAFAVQMEPPLIRMTADFIIKLLNQNISPLALNLMDLSIWPELWHAVLGKNYTPYVSMLKFRQAGERIHVLERYMNTREGICKKDDTLPLRLLNEGRACDADGRTVPLAPMLDKYYKIRGYDDNGIPMEKTLKRLGIEAK